MYVQQFPMQLHRQEYHQLPSSLMKDHEILSLLMLLLNKTKQKRKTKKHKTIKSKKKHIEMNNIITYHKDM